MNPPEETKISVAADAAVEVIASDAAGARTLVESDAGEAIEKKAAAASEARDLVAADALVAANLIKANADDRRLVQYAVETSIRELTRQGRKQRFLTATISFLAALLVTLPVTLVLNHQRSIDSKFYIRTNCQNIARLSKIQRVAVTQSSTALRQQGLILGLSKVQFNSLIKDDKSKIAKELVVLEVLAKANCSGF